MNIPKGTGQEELIYKKTKIRDLMLTFLPPINQKYEKAPVYFIIPGGGWHCETRQSMIDFSIQSVNALRQEGFAVVSIDYRVCGEGVVMREIITDCFDAARYIAHFAEILKIDAEKFVLSGHSAGAHLALMLAYAPKEQFRSESSLTDDFSAICVAAMSAPTVLYDRWTHNLYDIDDVFIGCNTQEEKEKMSPISYANETCPPTLLCAGTSDYLVFANSSEKLYDKLAECGVPSKLMLSVGGFHSFEQIHQTVTPSITMEEMQSAITEFVLQYAVK